MLTLYFKQEDQLVRLNEHRTGDGAQRVLLSKWQRFVLMEITFVFRKFEGFIHSSIGSRSDPVSRQAS